MPGPEALAQLAIAAGSVRGPVGQLVQRRAVVALRIRERAWRRQLIAEMGAAFLCAHCRIDGELHHAGYLASWLKVLRTDKRAIFVAATRAQQAADYLLKLAQPPDREAIAA